MIKVNWDNNVSDTGCLGSAEVSGEENGFLNNNSRD